MPELIQQKKYELQERTKQIIDLATSVLNETEEIRQRAYKTKDQALECGRLLLEEQDEVIKTMGKGSWESYCDIMFEKSLPRSTRFSWMKEYKESKIQKVGLPKSTNEQVVQEIRPESEANKLRNTMLTLNLFPAKKHQPTEEAGIDAPTPLPAAHDTRQLVSIVSRFASWHAAFMAEHRGALTPEECALLLADLKPISTFIDSLKA